MDIKLSICRAELPAASRGARVWEWFSVDSSESEKMGEAPVDLWDGFCVSVQSGMTMWPSGPPLLGKAALVHMWGS